MYLPRCPPGPASGLPCRLPPLSAGVRARMT